MPGRWQSRARWWSASSSSFPARIASTAASGTTARSVCRRRWWLLAERLEAPERRATRRGDRRAERVELGLCRQQVNLDLREPERGDLLRDRSRRRSVLRVELVEEPVEIVVADDRGTASEGD